MATREVHVKWLAGAHGLVGLPDLRPGDSIEIQGIGFSFEGAYYVASSTHTISDGSYVTRFDAEQAAVEPVDNKSYWHRRQPIELTVGVIKEVNRKAHEVEVRFLLPENKKKNFWIGVPDPGVSSNHGSWFMPDEGEEVLIAFEHGDARHPFVVGGLWHGEEEPPETNEPSTSL